MRTSLPTTLALTLLAGSIMASCQSTPSTPQSKAMDAVNPLNEDRQIWQQLLTDHASIQRRVVHRQEGDVGIVEATTESDDPAVASRIIAHAKAMQNRMAAGAPVRAWDPVFKEMFANHDKIAIQITPTDKGVRIVESSSDPETIALMRSHAMGVSDFIRNGHASATRATPKLEPGGPLPPPEVAIGGVPHRFLLAQPDAAQLSELKARGVSRIVSFRKPGEPGTYDEAAVAAADALGYCNIPYKDPAELTDTVLNQARAQFKEAQASGAALALHCRTGNRVGPGWAMYLALDKGVPVDQAIASAKAVGMIDPQYETITRQAIARELEARQQR